jgi:hypothetical protein
VKLLGEGRVRRELEGAPAARREARRARLVLEEPVHARFREACLPAPVVFDLPVALMIAFVPMPSAPRSTIRARQTCFCGVLRQATMASRRRRSAAKTEMEIPFRMLRTRTRGRAGEILVQDSFVSIILAQTCHPGRASPLDHLNHCRKETGCDPASDKIALVVQVPQQRICRQCRAEDGQADGAGRHDAKRLPIAGHTPFAR